MLLGLFECEVGAGDGEILGMAIGSMARLLCRILHTPIVPPALERGGIRSKAHTERLGKSAAKLMISSASDGENIVQKISTPPQRIVAAQQECSTSKGEVSTWPAFAPGQKRQGSVPEFGSSSSAAVPSPRNVS